MITCLFCHPLTPYYDSLIAFETERAQADLGMCDTVIDNIIRSCNAYLIDADHSFMAETFSSRLDEGRSFRPGKSRLRQK